MANPEGYNPMRWDCEQRGCFNKKRRPKIELFSKCFKGKISFGDVDGIVEVNGHALMLEWKTDTKQPTMGQRIMYERLSESSPITIFLIVGDAEMMVVSHFGKFHGGIYTPLVESSLDDVTNRISLWNEWAEKTPVGSMNRIKKQILELAFVAGLRRQMEAV